MCTVSSIMYLLIFVESTSNVVVLCSKTELVAALGVSFSDIVGSVDRAGAAESQ